MHHFCITKNNQQNQNRVLDQTPDLSCTVVTSRTDLPTSTYLSALRDLVLDPVETASLRFLVPVDGLSLLPASTKQLQMFSCGLTTNEVSFHCEFFFTITARGFVRGGTLSLGLFTVGRPVLHNFPGNILALCLFCQLVVELNQRINTPPAL